MLKNSSKIAISALLLASSFPESAECKQESIQDAEIDSQANLQLSAEEANMKHRKRHASKRKEQRENEYIKQQEYLMRQHQAVEQQRSKRMMPSQETNNKVHKQTKFNKSQIQDADEDVKPSKKMADDEDKPSKKMDDDEDKPSKKSKKMADDEDTPSLKKKKVARKVIDEDSNVVNMKKSTHKKKEDELEKSTTKDSEDDLDDLRKQFKAPEDESKKPKGKKFVDDDDDKEEEAKEDEPLKAKTIMDKQKDLETEKAALTGNTSVDVVKADNDVSDLKKDLKEYKNDLKEANELVKKAKFRLSTALNKEQEEEAAEELQNARDIKHRQEKGLVDTQRKIDQGTSQKLQAMIEAPIEASTDDEINWEKKDSFKEEAIAQRQMLSAQNELKNATTSVQEEIIHQKYKEAQVKKQVALIKRERAYAKEEKTDQTNSISDNMDTDKKDYNGPDPDGFHKAVTINAIQNLEQAIKTEKQMAERLENAEDDEEAISRKVDLQNAKLSKENAQKGLEKAEQTEEEAKQLKKKKALSKKILEKKMEEASDNAEYQDGQEKSAVKYRSSKKHLKDDDSAESEIAEAIKKGKAKAIDSVYHEPESTESSESTEKDSEEAPAKKEASEEEPEEKSVEEEPETEGESKAQKMRNYFKKSHIYNAYQEEQEEELFENHKIMETQKEINVVKYKMQNLMGKYQQLQNKVRQQNGVAKSLEEVERRRIKQQQQYTHQVRNEQQPQQQADQNKMLKSKQQEIKQAAVPVAAVNNEMQQPSQGKKSGEAIEQRLVKGENIMAKAKQHANTVNEQKQEMKPQQPMAKSAVKVEQKPTRIAKPRAFLTQRDSSDFVQQSEGDNIMPKQENKVALSQINATTLSNTTKQTNASMQTNITKQTNTTKQANTTQLINASKVTNQTSNFMSAANISVSQTVKNTTETVKPIIAQVKAESNSTIADQKNTVQKQNKTLNVNSTKTDVPTSRTQINNNKTNEISQEKNKTATSNQTQPVKALVQKPEPTQKNQTQPAKEVSKPVEIKSNEQSNKTHSSPPSSKSLVQLKEYPNKNIQNLAQGYEGMFRDDKRLFEFEDQGDYVQLHQMEYPNKNIQNLAQGYEGMFNEDKRLFPEFEDKGDYVQIKSSEYPGQNVQKLAQGYEGMFNEDKRMFPEFEDKGDYVQLKAREYPGQNVQKLAQGYEGMFSEDKRMFPEFEDKGDYVQLKSEEYPNGNVQSLAQGYEGMFREDKRMFKDSEEQGDY